MQAHELPEIFAREAEGEVPRPQAKQAAPWAACFVKSCEQNASAIVLHTRKV
jgi:hypothetical protein